MHRQFFHEKKSQNRDCLHFILLVVNDMVYLHEFKYVFFFYINGWYNR